MTEWITRPERHIPEDELHAYLDQALSRSQCAEIETHLSGCKVCQARRGGVAGLRDRTTALLSGLAPRPVIVPPDYQVLRDKQSRRLALAVWRARLQRAGLWAAGVVAAVGAGWMARSALDPHRVSLPTPVQAQALAPDATPAPAPADPITELERQATPVPLPQSSSPSVTGRQADNREAEPLVPAPTLQLASVVSPVRYPAAVEPSLAARSPDAQAFGKSSGIVPWEDALQIAGSGLPFIEGIPVVGVLFQPGTPGERPTIVVAQQDQNGEMILSIEGPVATVAQLLQRQGSSEIHWSEPTRTPPDYIEGPGGGMRRALRVLRVTGRLPVDSLNTLARVATIR